MDTIGCAGLAYVKLIRRYRKGIRFSLCYLFFSQKLWIFPLKDKKVN